MADINNKNESENNYNSEDIPEIIETTPLIRNRSNNNNNNNCCNGAHIIYLSFLILLLLIGATISIYLLVMESVEWKAQGTYTFMSREEWKAHEPRTQNMSLLQLPVKKVLFELIPGPRCSEAYECQKRIHDIQFEEMFKLNKSDITYNFVMVRQYIIEGRGWKYRSIGDNQTISIGFFRGPLEVTPSFPEENQMKLFLDIAVLTNKLIPCYQVITETDDSFVITMASSVREDYILGCN